MMKWILLISICLLGASCKYTEVEREIGYKGKARVNPWLAAEKFSAQYDYEVVSSYSWTPPEWQDAAWFVPASVIGNRSFARQMEEWVNNGGHLILLVEYATSETNDWGDTRTTVNLEPPLLEWFERADIKFQEEDSKNEDHTATNIRFDDRDFTVDASSRASIAASGESPGVFVSQPYGEGTLTVVTDARIFRNRWIGDQDHAALLLALIESHGYGERVGFMRGTGLSFWSLLGNHLWQVLVALGLWLVFWLWRNFSRFGPLESAETPNPSRGYEHHLEALGDFQWRLDRAAALLVPLRHHVIERGQRAAARMGRRDEDFFQFLATHAGLTRERVHRALAEAAPPDSAVLTRTTADLQTLIKSLN